MNKSLLRAAGVVGLLGVLAITQLVAQQPAAAPPSSRTGVALVDLGVVMKHSNRFNQAMDRLKADYEAKAQELKKQGEYGNQLTDQMRQMPENSPERKNLEEKLLKMRANYEIDGKRITDDTRDAESKIVFGLVREVQAELERYGQATGTLLILRGNPDPPNLDDPRIILQEIHKPIVYDSGLDATSAVLNSLNRGTTPPPTANRPAQQQGFQR